MSVDIQLIDDCSDFLLVTTLTPKARGWVLEHLTIYPDERIDENNFKMDNGDGVHAHIKKMVKSGLSVKLDDDIVSLAENGDLKYVAVS